jgi:hypothetical protein
MPPFAVAAHADCDTQLDMLDGDHGTIAQGAVEILGRFDLDGAGERLAREALALLAAPNCPTR